MPKKKYDANRQSAKVTFSLPAEVEAESVVLCGDFNGWDPSTDRLKRAADGSWKVVVELDANRSYAYRFLIDGHRWENDWEAERYQANEFGSEDGIIDV